MRKLFWLDMEMSGLDHEKERILEAAVIITDMQFNELDRYVNAVTQPKELLDNMDAWCKATHGKSGLVARVLSEGISEEQVDKDLAKFAEKHFGRERVVLCGNSIGQDRKFVDKYLPLFAAKLHYRMLDVSSFKIVFENMFQKRFPKKHKHLALDDIRESIGELKYYLNFVEGNKKAESSENQVTDGQ